MHTDFRPIFDSAPLGMLLADQRGLIKQTNPRLDAMFGFEPGELVDRPSELLFPERYRERHGGMRDVYHTRPQQRIIGFDRDLTGRRKSGEEFPVEISICPMATPEGQQFCAMISDITDQKRGELRLREAGTLLDQIAQALSRDVHDQIHEIATTVAFRAENFDTPIPDDLRHTLRRLTSCLSDIEYLLNELSLYSRSRFFPLPSEVIDLGAVIDEVIARESPGARVSIDVAVPPETFTGARAALSGVLRSLISNSIKHHDREEVRIEIHARLEGDQCLIDYADDGPGIPRATQERMFGLFQTGSGDLSKGSGIGLAIVQRLVEGHGATMSLIGRDDARGARFRIWWPRYPRADRSA